MCLKRKLLVPVIFALSTVCAQADNLVIPGHYTSDSNSILPRRGINMDQVLSEFGEPDMRNDAVGEPPITEWDYGDFKVYFEYQTVLHTVNLKTMIMPK